MDTPLQADGGARHYNTNIEHGGAECWGYRGCARELQLGKLEREDIELRVW